MWEFEYKAILEKKQYEEIMKSQKLVSNESVERNVQINYYFDTDNNDLHCQGITLRIRQIDSQLCLQLKVPIKAEGVLNVKDEFSQIIEDFYMEINFKKTSLKEYLPNLDLVIFKGLLVTERNVFKISDGIVMCLDKNSYLGMVDYELEIEFDQKKKQEALDLFKNVTNNATITPQVGKKERFFNRLEGLLKVTS